MNKFHRLGALSGFRIFPLREFPKIKKEVPLRSLRARAKRARYKAVGLLFVVRRLFKLAGYAGSPICITSHRVRRGTEIYLKAFYLIFLSKIR